MDSHHPDQHVASIRCLLVHKSSHMTRQFICCTSKCSQKVQVKTVGLSSTLICRFKLPLSKLPHLGLTLSSISTISLMVHNYISSYHWATTLSPNNSYSRNCSKKVAQKLSPEENVIIVALGFKNAPQQLRHKLCGLPWSSRRLKGGMPDIMRYLKNQHPSSQAQVEIQETCLLGPVVMFKE